MEGQASTGPGIEQQFFKWLATGEEIPDPMAGLKSPHVPGKPVLVFTGEDLSQLERACVGRSFWQCRDAAVIAVLKATGIRLPELAGIPAPAGRRRTGTSPENGRRRNH